MDADMEVCGRDPDSRFAELAAKVFAMHVADIVNDGTSRRHHSGSRTTP